MVQDINPGAEGGSPQWLTDVDGTLYFAGNGGVADWELWRSDGTADGTTLVMDIAPGPDGSFPSFLIDLDGELYFTAERRNHGVELWRSDGSPQGTIVVADIAPRGFTVVGDTLFFPARGREERSGALEERRNGCGHRSGPRHQARFSGLLSRSRSRTSTERCSSRRTSVRPVSSFGRATGPPEGTELVRDLFNGKGGSYPTSLTSVGRQVFFSAANRPKGEELWRSDGTAKGHAARHGHQPRSRGLIPSVLRRPRWNAAVRRRRRDERRRAMEERRDLDGHPEGGGSRARVPKARSPGHSLTWTGRCSSRLTTRSEALNSGEAMARNPARRSCVTCGTDPTAPTPIPSRRRGQAVLLRG